jgi:hypothetical protein
MRYVLARVESDPRLKSGERVRYFGVEFETASALLPVLTKARELGIRGPLAIIERPGASDLAPTT